MPANAQVYQTTTIGDTSPTLAAETIIATISGVAIDTWATIVRVDALIVATIGADTSEIELRIRRNTATGTQIGATATYTVVPATAYGMNVTGIGAEPAGTHNYVITIVQTDASVDCVVDAVTAVAVVGN